jgi:AcrR family transcriptional regulator
MQTQTRTRVCRAVFRLHSEPGSDKVTVRNIARAAGVPSNSLYYWYGDMGTLYRLSVADHIDRLKAELESMPDPTPSVRDAILDYARICAEAFGSDAYQRLLYLVIRDGAAHPWLVKKHQSDILDVIQATHARVVARAGRSRGAQLEIRSSAGRAFVKRLQGELALPMLLPGRKQPTRQELRLLTEAVAGAALDAVYAPRMVTDELGRLPSNYPWTPAKPAAGHVPQPHAANR